MEIRKIELRNIKTKKKNSPRHHYSADVYINGKKAITVKNNGFQDDDDKVFHEPFDSDIMYLLDDYLAINCVALSLPEGTVFSRLEDYCTDEVNDFLRKKELRDIFEKKEKLLILNKGELAFMSIAEEQKRVFDDKKIKELFPKLKKKGMILLNAMPLEEAIHFYAPRLLTEGQFFPLFDKDGNCINC